MESVLGPLRPFLAEKPLFKVSLPPPEQITFCKETGLHILRSFFIRELPEKRLMDRWENIDEEMILKVIQMSREIAFQARFRILSFHLARSKEKPIYCG